MIQPIFQPGDSSWLIPNIQLEVDCDGSPFAYNHENTGLDDLANAGPASDPYGYLLNPHTGQPYRQGFDAEQFNADSKGFFVSTTTYQRREHVPSSPFRYLDAETEAFGVIPGWFRRSVPGVVIGCRMTWTARGVTIEGLAGDVGPGFGEASIAVVKALGGNPDGRRGGTDFGVDIRIWPGKPADGYELQPM